MASAVRVAAQEIQHDLNQILISSMAIANEKLASADVSMPSE
jgi:hypothetical protein